MDDIKAILIVLAIGAVAGWLAGKIMRGAGIGLLGNIIVGVVGSALGTWLFGEVLGIRIGGNQYVTATIFAVGGSCLLLFVIGLIQKKK